MNRIIVIICVFLSAGVQSSGQPGILRSPNSVEEELKSVRGLVALWTFDEKKGDGYLSKGPFSCLLKEAGGRITSITEGPLSGKSLSLDGTAYLFIPNSETGKLNISGDKSEVTVIAWIKWSGEQTGFVAGMWNEYEDGGRRQYGLFASLPHYNGGNQVCGHISKTGHPTPPFPYSIDYSASKQKIPVNEWCCIAFTYNGKYIKSFLNGKFEAREPELIDHTKGFEGHPDGLIQVKNPYYFPDGIGNNGSDFTVGAVRLKTGMGNFYKGLIGGIAVFDRALTEKEIRAISG